VAQRLLELLKSNPELNLFVRLSLIDALGALKATFAVSSLQEMLTTEDTTNAKEQIIITLGVIGNKEVASSLLDSLLDTTTDPKIKLTIAQALRNLKDESLTHRILEKLQDGTIEWQVRWLLTESLEGLQESAKDSLMKMLESQAIDESVQVGIAATLGTWGVRESIPYLRNAIHNKVVPLSWQQGYHTSCGYIWGRITRVLNSLGDESVVPILKQAFMESWVHPKFAKIPECDRLKLAFENDNQVKVR
jgi:HEAT repeat protein